MIANALMHVWEAQGVDVGLKYEDDIKNVRYATRLGPVIAGVFRYDFDYEDMMAMVAPLLTPWNDKGDTDFVFLTTFIGYLWHFAERWVGFTEEKRMKFLQRAEVFAASFAGTSCALEEVNKIHGSLCHVAFVHTIGTAYLSSLSNFAASFKGNEFVRRHPPPSVISDVKWWVQKLSVPNFTRPLKVLGLPKNLRLFADASTSWGIGILIGGKWAAFRLVPNWKELAPGRDIGWLETIAIEILLLFLQAMKVTDAHLLIHSDNQGSIGSFRKGRCPNPFINLSIRRSFTTLVATGISPAYEYIETSLNPADPISRGEFGPPELKLRTRIVLPEELHGLLVHV